MMSRIGVTQPALLSALFAMIRMGGGLQRLFDSVFAQLAFVLAAEEKARFAQNLRRFLKAVPHSLWQGPEQHVQAVEEVEALLGAAMTQEQLQAGASHWVAV